jgi:hypothetical protein
MRGSPTAMVRDAAPQRIARSEPASLAGGFFFLCDALAGGVGAVLFSVTFGILGLLEGGRYVNRKEDSGLCSLALRQW